MASRRASASDSDAFAVTAMFLGMDIALGFGEPGWLARALAELETDVANGARGLKVYKSLGLDSKDAAGERIAVDDPRLDPIWAKCGELGIPVLIHSAIRIN